MLCQRIVAGFTGKWMAMQNPFSRFKAAPKKPVLLYRLIGVFRTAGTKAAASRHSLSDELLVNRY